MAGLGPDIAAEIVAACGEGAAAAGESLSKALGGTIEMTPGEAGKYDAAAPPDGFDGGALVVSIKEESKGVAFVVPAAGGLLPDWCADPSDEEKSKLTALAEGLCESLFGEAVLIDFFQAEHVANLGEALTRAGIADDASLVPLGLKAEDDKTAAACLLWPLNEPDAVFAAAAAEEPEPAAADEPAAAEEAEPAPAASTPPPASTSPEPAAPTPAASQDPRRSSDLPPYMKSLMKVEIPLSTTLARSKQTVADITSLGPGAIIQFEKGCDELLELYAGGQLIARGEAVKVGDKFGFQIKQMELPLERFEKLG